MQGKIQCGSCRNMIPVGPFCPFCGSEQVPRKDEGREKKPGGRNRASVPVVKTGMDTTVPVYVGSSSGQGQGDAGTGSRDAGEVSGGTITEAGTGAEIPAGTGQPAEHGPERDNETAGERSGRGEADSNGENPVAKGIREHRDRKNQRDAEYERTHDTLTGVYNREEYRRKLTETDASDAGIILCSVENLQSVRKQLGETNGDLLVSNVAQALEAVFGGDNCYRTDGDGFAVILSGISEGVIRERILGFKKELRNRERRQAEDGVQIDMKAATGFGTGDGRMAMEEITGRAEKMLEEEKTRLKSVYDPNYDGYYNDVKAQYEELRVEINRENIHKAVMVVILFIITMIVYFLFL